MGEVSGLGLGLVFGTSGNTLETIVVVLTSPASCVTASGVSMKYRDDLPPVLKSLDFEATPAQKIGIVGRTGAGTHV